MTRTILGSSLFTDQKTIHNWAAENNYLDMPDVPNLTNLLLSLKHLYLEMNSPNNTKSLEHTVNSLIADRTTMLKFKCRDTNLSHDLQNFGISLDTVKALDSCVEDVFSTLYSRLENVDKIIFGRDLLIGYSDITCFTLDVSHDDWNKIVLYSPYIADHVFCAFGNKNFRPLLAISLTLLKFEEMMLHNNDKKFYLNIYDEDFEDKLHQCLDKIEREGKSNKSSILLEKFINYQRKALLSDITKNKKRFSNYDYAMMLKIKFKSTVSSLLYPAAKQLEYINHNLDAELVDAQLRIDTTQSYCNFNDVVPLEKAIKSRFTFDS